MFYEFRGSAYESMVSADAFHIEKLTEQRKSEHVNETTCACASSKN